MICLLASSHVVRILKICLSHQRRHGLPARGNVRQLLRESDTSKACKKALALDTMTLKN